MQGISPWLAAAKDSFAHNLPPLFQKMVAGFTFNVHNTGDALWIIALWPGGGRLAFRAAFAPDAALLLLKMDKGENEVTLQLQSAIGQYAVKLEFPAPRQPLFHCTTTLTPASSLLIPFWPRDLVALGDEGDAAFAHGEVYVHQVGPRSGLLYAGISRPRAGHRRAGDIRCRPGIWYSAPPLPQGAGDPFMIFVDYPVTGFTIQEGPAVCFSVEGDERLYCPCSCCR